MMKNKLLRADEKVFDMITQLKSMSSVKSDNDVLIKAVEYFYYNQVENSYLFENLDKYEMVVLNQISMLLRKQTEDIAAGLNYIAHQQKIITMMLEIMLITSTNLPEDFDKGKEVIQNNLYYFEKLKEDIYES